MDWHGFARRTARTVARSALGVVAFLFLGNLAITVAWQWEARRAGTAPVDVEVDNFEVVDAEVWRGGAPGEVSYRDLAANGVRVVVDLRGEDDLEIDRALLRRLDIHRIHLPMRDGQTPSATVVRKFLEIVHASESPVFVHCGAGVGRTGTLVAAYRVASGQTDGLGAMRRNLRIGPPSLEQLAFAASLDHEEIERVAPAVVAVSRVLDAPRRIWTRLRD